MGTQNCDTRKSMKDIKLHLPSAESIETIFADNTSVSKKEIITNQTTLHSTQLIRNVPNILRNSNIKTYRTKTLTSDKSDISFTSSTEDINISVLNTTLSSNESEKEIITNYKIASPKLYHQRKQVHNPIDTQYDVPDWINKDNKNILQEFDELNTSHVLQSYKKNVSKRKLKHNKRKRNLFNKKSKETTICKSDSSMEKSFEKLDFDTGLTISSDINIKDTVVQNATFSSNVLTESTNGSDTAKYINNLNNVEIQSNELYNTSYCDEICNFEKYDINCNSVIPSKSTEFCTLQPELFQEDVTNFKILRAKEDFKEELINRDIASDFLFDSKVLYTCTCVNCTSCDKDIIFCEDPVSTSTNSDTDTEFSTSYIYDPFIYDYQIGDNILDDNWLKEFDKKNFCCEEVEETNITKETACIDSNNVIELIESNTNVPSVEQSNTQNSQTRYINKIQDICVKSYSPEPIKAFNEPIQSSKSAENAKILDEADHINLENILVKEDKVISQDEVFAETTNSTDESIFKSKFEKENKKDLCVIQCTQCRRLFNKKHQFRKHFTRCDFYKEDFKCHICDKIYKHKSSFDQHLRKVHHLSCNPDQKFYTCNRCSKSYVRFRAYQKHLLLHDD
ncbi:uncharacterized protein [Linepithema humile]|nr:PREDICTED: uncharacterized protein LOC105674016 isoform X2 [Linepithema humile]